MKVAHELPQYFAEFIGTFFMVFFGCGSIILSQVQGGYEASLIPIIWGGSVSVMIYAVGHISGAHFNPAVTIAFWVARKFPAKRVMGYILFQILGAVCASLIHLAIFGSEHNFGATSSSVNLLTAALIEVILSFALMFVIISVATDSRAVGEIAGVSIGLTVALCAFVGGPLTNASMNPARSLGPALISGELSGVLLYLTAPVVGTVLGALSYEWIRCHKDDTESDHGCC